MNSVLAISLLMLSGVVAGRVVVGWGGLSSVVGYLIAGIAIGQIWPSIVEVITLSEYHSLLRLGWPLLLLLSVASLRQTGFVRFLAV